MKKSLLVFSALIVLAGTAMAQRHGGFGGHALVSRGGFAHASRGYYGGHYGGRGYYGGGFGIGIDFVAACPPPVVYVDEPYVVADPYVDYGYPAYPAVGVEIYGGRGGFPLRHYVSHGYGGYRGGYRGAVRSFRGRGRW